MSIFWSAAMTHPHNEALAIRNLRRQQFTAFYPFFLIPTRWKRLSVRPVFPGYVFVELDDQDPNWSPINSTFGVKRLLTNPQSGDDYRVPAKIGFIDDLRRLRLRGSADHDEALPPGTQVRILRGPFAERVALVELSDQDRVRLLLEVFNREISISFSLDQIELIRRPIEPARPERIIQ
jgi:transcriptional antiterminator RfaH